MISDCCMLTKMKLNLTQHDRKGFVLIIVLGFVILLELLVIGFNYKTRTSLNAVDRFQKSEQAFNYAGTGLNIAIELVKKSYVEDDMSVSDLLGEKTVSLDNGKCTITISEENAKINVNLLKDKNNNLSRAKIDQFLRVIDLLNHQNTGDDRISYSVVPLIIDWIDKDEEVTYLPFIKNQCYGAESNYYSKSSPPYNCRNEPIKNLKELLSIKSITPDILDIINDHITVYGDDKININSASELMIKSLSEDMDTVLASIIIEHREQKPFQNITEIRKLPGMTEKIYHEIQNLAAVNPTQRYFHVASKGKFDRHQRTIKAILQKNNRTKSIDVILYEEF